MAATTPEPTRESNTKPWGIKCTTAPTLDLEESLHAESVCKETREQSVNTPPPGGTGGNDVEEEEEQKEA
jgi:hypothetical protein